MATRSRASVMALLLVLLAVAGCGVIPQTGPPEGDFFERGSHGHP